MAATLITTGARCNTGEFSEQRTSNPTFDVVSIRRAPSNETRASGIVTSPGFLNGQYVTLLRCIQGAYSVDPNRVIGMPSWGRTDHFDILARTVPTIGTDLALMVMLRDVLADRFLLKVHEEERISPVYVLETLNGANKLKPASSRRAAETGTASMHHEKQSNEAGISMPKLAELLSRNLDRPVIDETHLPGAYEVKLHWSPASTHAVSNDDGPSIFTAVTEQLGLHLRAERRPVSVIVVDSVSPPSPN